MLQGTGTHIVHVSDGISDLRVAGERGRGTAEAGPGEEVDQDSVAHDKVLVSGRQGGPLATVVECY